jgi:hypothetical protein
VCLTVEMVIYAVVFFGDDCAGTVMHKTMVHSPSPLATEILLVRHYCFCSFKLACSSTILGVVTLTIEMLVADHCRHPDKVEHMNARQC